jgi:hypothetical protein
MQVHRVSKQNHIMVHLATAFSSEQSGPAATAGKSPAKGSMPSPKAGLGASEHQPSGSLEHALNRTLSWDLPQPPRRKEKIRKNIDQLHPPASAPLNEDGLPTPEPFKIKMVETIALLPRAKREALLAKAGFNVFCLRSDQVCVCVCACVRACVRACVWSCVRACVRACVRSGTRCVCGGGELPGAPLERRQLHETSAVQTQPLV